MSRHISDLQAILSQLAGEHRKLFDQLESQHAAMKKFDLTAIADSITRSESTRLRINDLESRRRNLMRQITITLKLPAEPKLTRLAELFPPQADGLLKVRRELRDLATKISRRSQGSSRLATAVLGHLNTVVRLLAGAVERSGLYSKQGIPRVVSRVGVMDAVG
jgi:FlgN protein